MVSLSLSVFLRLGAVVSSRLSFSALKRGMVLFSRGSEDCICGSNLFSFSHRENGIIEFSLLKLFEDQRSLMTKRSEAKRRSALTLWND